MYCQLESGVYVSSVYVYSAIFDSYLVIQYFRDLLSIGVEGVDVSSVYVHCALCVHLCGVMVFHRCIVNWTGGICILGICAFYYMCNLCGVMVFQRSIVNWSGGYMYPQYMYILLHVKVMLCNGIP